MDTQPVAADLAPNGGYSPRRTFSACGDMLTCGTRQKLEFINLTGAVEQYVRDSGIRNGMAVVQSLHATASVFVNEWQDALLDDFRTLLERAVPGDAPWRHNDPRYSDENLPKNLKVVEAIGAVADKHGASKAQVALAWLLAQGDNVVPIPGVKRRQTMEDSVGAADVVLTTDDLAALDAASPRGATAGDRYNARGMAMVRR